jgi:hypothetical protein
MILFVSLLSTLPHLAAGADEALDKRAAESLVKAFLAVCPQIGRDRNNAFSAAKLHGWVMQEASTNGPDASDPNTTTWLVTDLAEVPFLLSVTSISKGSDLRAICAVENPDAPEGPVTFALENTLGGEVPLGSHIEGDLRLHEWLIDGNTFRVSLTTRIQPGARGVKIVGLQLTNTVAILFTTFSILFPIIIITIIAILIIVYVRRSYRPVHLAAKAHLLKVGRLIEIIGIVLAWIGGVALAVVLLIVFVNGTWPGFLRPVKALFGVISELVGSFAFTVEVVAFIGPGLLVMALGQKLKKE